MAYDKKHKLLFVLTIILTIAAVAITVYLYCGVRYDKVDTVEINRVRTELESGNTPTKGKYQYIALDNDGNVVASTMEYEAMSLSSRINTAIQEGNAVVDWAKGKIVFYTGLPQLVASARQNTLIISLSLIVAVFVAFLLQSLYIDRRIFRPFRKMNDFAKAVANDDWTQPLPMDRNNNFGAFTEAFDIMRTNVLHSREEADEAQKSKRALLAELGHDIRTPLSTILACAELRTAEGVKGMDSIINKAQQIDKLLADIYSSSLEDIGLLRVENTTHSVEKIVELIHAADPKNFTNIVCNVQKSHVIYDDLRLQECVDNVLLNAQKYATGNIDVEISTRDMYIAIVFQDHGDGIDQEELAYVTDRFYRGKKAQGKSGMGLGLYITKKLLERMGGDMEIINNNGLRITFLLPQLTVE